MICTSVADQLHMDCLLREEVAEAEAEAEPIEPIGGDSVLRRRLGAITFIYYKGFKGL